MSPIHSRKNGRRYRYYISQAEVQGKPLAEDTIARVPAAELENTLSQYIQQLLHQDDKLFHIVNEPSPFMRRRGKELAEGWNDLKQSQKHVLIRTVISKAILSKTQINIMISPVGLSAILRDEKHITKPSDDDVIH